MEKICYKMILQQKQNCYKVIVENSVTKDFCTNKKICKEHHMSTKAKPKYLGWKPESWCHCQVCLHFVMSM